jgi:hypothetical protein
MILGEDDSFEEPTQSARLREPAAVGQQADPVAGPERFEAGKRVGEESGVSIPVDEVGSRQLSRQGVILRLGPPGPGVAQAAQ